MKFLLAIALFLLYFVAPVLASMHYQNLLVFFIAACMFMLGTIAYPLQMVALGKSFAKPNKGLFRQTIDIILAKDVLSFLFEKK